MHLDGFVVPLPCSSMTLPASADFNKIAVAAVIKRADALVSNPFMVYVSTSICRNVCVFIFYFF